MRRCSEEVQWGGAVRRCRGAVQRCIQFQGAMLQCALFQPETQREEGGDAFRSPPHHRSLAGLEEAKSRVQHRLDAQRAKRRREEAETKRKERRITDPPFR